MNRQPNILNGLTSKIPYNSPCAQKITESIAIFICKDTRPYSADENNGFCYMPLTDESKGNPETLQQSEKKHCCVLTVSRQGGPHVPRSQDSYSSK
ncbi:Zinc finger BED domain-containing protein 4 [Labeo rohita]|uniref:Zinc finger BED domain-containing protein 4 n=1 Tax=Labeo rohita TaxID=84645 RepID=A0ABQ8MHH9_LABRO|nr:Zinc finger BED domain-containing protein 4 [Labeo rohita]